MKTFRLLTVKNLLVVIMAVAGVTLGLFKYEANRALDKLDTVATATTNASQQIAVMAESVKELSGRVSNLEYASNDHEHRITVLETRDGVSPDPKTPKGRKP